MINVCVPNGSPIVSCLVIEVQGNNGNVSSMTLDRMLDDTWRLVLGAFECFLVGDPSC